MMNLSTPTKTLDQTIAAIEALDLGPIKFKANRKEDGYGWSAEYADRVETAYKRYLILVAKYATLTLAPNRDIDRFWHMHILDTRKYAEDCEATFGHFMHHFPYSGLRGEDDARAHDMASETMRQLYAREFGEAMPAGAAHGTVEPAAAWSAFERDPDETSVRPGSRIAHGAANQSAAWSAFERDPDKTSVRPGARAVA
jgi:hypothetical protein